MSGKEYNCVFQDMQYPLNFKSQYGDYDLLFEIQNFDLKRYLWVCGEPSRKDLGNHTISAHSERVLSGSDKPLKLTATEDSKTKLDEMCGYQSTR